MTPTEFYDLLEAHDWNHFHADDHRAWMKGVESREAILAATKDNPEYQALFLAYADYVFKDGTKPERPYEE